MKITTSWSSGIRVSVAIAALLFTAPALLRAVPADEESTALDAIAGKLQELGGARTQALGPTLGTLQPAAGGRARFQAFAQGAIYWSAATGAHVLEGAAYDAWRQLGAEGSELGLPVSDPRDVGNGNLQTLFEHGAITVTAMGAPLVRTFPGSTLSEGGIVFSPGVRVRSTSESSVAVRFLPTSPFGGEGSFSCNCEGPVFGRICKAQVENDTLRCVKSTCSTSCKLVVTF